MTNTKNTKTKETITAQEKNQNKYVKISIKFFSFLVGFSILILSQYAFIFIILATFPSIASIFIDKRRNKAASSTLCAFNIIAILPFSFQLWNCANMNSMAQSLIVDINVWFIIYGVTAIGWVIISTIPQVVAKIFQIQSLSKIEKMNKQMQDLIEIWGEDVSN